MNIQLKWKYAEGELDTKTLKMVSIHARGQRVSGPYEEDAQLCIRDGWNFGIAEIKLGDVDSSNILCDEIVRRWNEFPEELKR